MLTQSPLMLFQPIWLPPQNATFLPDAFPDRGPDSPANHPDPTHPVIMQGIRIIDRVAIPGSWCVSMLLCAAPTSQPGALL